MSKKASDNDISRRFQKELLLWNTRENKRQMPWKGEKDPYKIWLSEIILQQTRVDQGLNYYKQIVEAFPSVKDLAKAPEQEVFKLWEGLGYYSRCRNLISSAKQVVAEQNGIFPRDYEAILALKGVGSYTAAAIASFAYNLPFAVLDGNVFRVLSRIFDIETPIDSTQGKKLFSALAQNLLPEGQSALYNQAIMDFGATVCKPAPDCGTCFFNTYCKAFIEGKQLALPVKEKKTLVKKRWFNYVVLKNGDRYAIKQRLSKDIWQSLYEFPLIETEKKTTKKNILLQFEKNYSLDMGDYTATEKPNAYQQRLSHQLIYFQFIKIQLSKITPPLHKLNWLTLDELKNYPFPRTLQTYIHEQL